jgi:hypothetical protein
MKGLVCNFAALAPARRRCDGEMLVQQSGLADARQTCAALGKGMGDSSPPWNPYEEERFIHEDTDC